MAMIVKSEMITNDKAPEVLTAVRRFLRDELDRQALARIVDEASLPFGVVTTSGRLACPECGAVLPSDNVDENDEAAEGDFQQIEDIGCGRSINRQDDKTIHVDGYYETEGFDEGGENQRLYCNGCDREFVLPDDFEFEWE